MAQLPTTAAAVLEATGIDAGLLRDVMPRVDPARVLVRVPRRAFLRTWSKGIQGVTTPWAVYFHPDVAQRLGRGEGLRRVGRLMVHELMHVEQLRRMGVVRHSTRYVADYLRGRFRGVSHWDAYLDVRLEAEARAATRLVMGRVA